MVRLRELRDQNRESMERGLISLKVTRARKGENMANPKTANEALREALIAMQRAREQAEYEALEQQKAQRISQMMPPLSPLTQMPQWIAAASFGSAGQVSLWGRIVETENGYRAERAYPSELWLFDESLEELGLIYDVPVRIAR